MTSRLRELIKGVRQCKTAAEERNVIAKESAALRNAFRDQDSSYRHRNVAKLMYIHMLGYPTHFGQMETLKLIAANGFAEKRIGYLGLMILLDERQEVLMLVTNSLKNDLGSRNQSIVGLALTALGNICSAEMARDLAPEVEKLLSSSNSYIRKKAALCATRIVRKVPEVLEEFVERAPQLMQDRHHGVLLGGATLLLEICDVDPAQLDTLRPHVPLLCKILRSLLLSGFAPEHDVGGITDPFLQVKVLRLLRLLGKGNAEASDTMSDVLAQVATNTEVARNAGNAILYECVQTIMGVESIGGLRVLAVNILGRFLGNRDNNIRYVALNTLAKVVGVDTQAVQRHRNTIVECVKDADVSIRRRALELVYALVNQGNIRTLTKELLDYLRISDSEFKPDLTNKICMLVQRFAPDKRWHLDSLMQVIVQAGAYVKEEVCRALVVLVSNAPELHAYAARLAMQFLKQHRETASHSLLITSTWFLGEYGELLLPGAAGSANVGSGDDRPRSASSTDLVTLLEGVLERTQEAAAREYTLTALMKLSARLPDQLPRIQGVLEKQKGSVQLEVQTRSCEYGRIFKYDAIRPQLLEHMPALDEATYSRNLGSALPTDTAAAAPQVTAEGDLISTSEPTANGPTTAPVSQTSDAVADLLSMDLGGGGGTGLGASGAATSTAAADLLDLLGGADLSAPPAPTSSGSNALDLLGEATPAPTQNGGLEDLLGGASSPAEVEHPPLTAFEKDGLRVVFTFKQNHSQPGLTDITATYTNAGSESVSDFSLQAAVPKFMQLKLDPASGSSLQPNSGNSLTQVLHVTNSQQGTKSLAMRLRISFKASDEQKLEQCEVRGFPSGL